MRAWIRLRYWWRFRVFRRSIATIVECKIERGGSTAALLCPEPSEPKKRLQYGEMYLPWENDDEDEVCVPGTFRTGVQYDAVAWTWLFLINDYPSAGISIDGQWGPSS